MSGELAGAREGVARMRDGTRIAYRLIGDRGGRRCVLVHSLAMDRSFWSRVVPLLADRCDVLVYDCRGHGRSDKPLDAPYSIEGFADDLADLMDAVGWPSATVCGASMGGCVSLAFAAAYPERVEGLGLFDTTAWYGDGAEKAWAERADKALKGGMEALIDFQKTRWFSDAFREARPDVVEATVGVFLANDLQAFALTCRMLGAVDKRSALGGMRFPTEILVGDEDYATPVAMAEAMAAALPDARVRVLEGARHFTPLEAPGPIAETIAGLTAPRR